MNNPIQPVVEGADGTLRFKQNAIVRHLVDWARRRDHTLDDLTEMNFTSEDWRQLFQLLGYTLDGYSELSCVDDEAYSAAARVATRCFAEKNINECIKGATQHFIAQAERA